MELLFSPEAGNVLDELGRDASNDALVDAIWDALDLISEHPGSAQARHRGLRTAGGHPVWLVPVRGQHHDEVWAVLWQPRDDDALIAYIGPADFRPRRLRPGVQPGRRPIHTQAEKLPLAHAVP